MFFPYSTDAPIYHWPITTVVMIVVNILVFCAVLANPDCAESLVLERGNGLHPSQWITSNFIHGGLLHLIGNMLSLWSFGLVVEGKLGWYKTLAFYLGIGLIQCAAEQLLMLGSHDGASCGASAIIFGFMAASLIWAPENEMHCIFLLGFRVLEFDVKIVGMVGLLVALQIGIAIFNDVAMSSEVLHLMGAAVGFGVSIVMLKAGLVDCENWDVFSVWAGRHTMTPEDRERADAETPEYRERQEANLQKRRETGLAEIRQMLQGGQAVPALEIHRRLSRQVPDWTLSEPDLLCLIKALHQEKLWAESVPIMEEYLSCYTQKAVPVRLKLAQILLMESRQPTRAMKVLSKIDAQTLDSSQREFLQKLQAKAKQLREQDVYEVADDDV